MSQLAVGRSPIQRFVKVDDHYYAGLDSDPKQRLRGEAPSSDDTRHAKRRTDHVDLRQGLIPQAERSLAKQRRRSKPTELRSHVLNGRNRLWVGRVAL